MRFVEIIRKKRDGGTLTREELSFFIEGICNGSIPDYQTSALLMAVFLKGMDDGETAALCQLMTESGSVLELDESLPTVDKHSTGGVGDKTTFIISPAVASLGLYVAKMSGRGLGHTGGTIDKLEAIPGFRTELEPDEFKRIYMETGLCIIGQTGNMVPADKILYGLRDLTATVDSIPLIATSIMSKKLAGGAKSMVLDVKAGEGSFMKDEQAAIELAKVMVRIGDMNGRNVSALITTMDQPLGYCVGNAIEVEESIEMLKGKDIPDLMEISTALAGEMLHLAKGTPVDKARVLAAESMKNGKALEKLKEMIRAQGGDDRVAEDYSLFGQSGHILEVFSEEEGYVTSVKAMGIGKASMDCGAGRTEKDSPVDHTAGVRLDKKAGDHVRKGERLARAYTSFEEHGEIIRGIRQSYTFSKEKPKKRKLILARVTRQGTERL
ncbi:MAG: thymidine phosphorylase [Clostridia bacterium]